MLTHVRKFFLFEQRNATFKKEIIGGISAFLTMCYILAVNPQILNGGYQQWTDSVTHLYQGLNEQQVMGGLFLITALVTFVGTICLGLFTNLPAAASSSLGCNTFFAYTLTTSLHVSPAGGMLAAVISSVCFFILSVTNVRKYLFNNIPAMLKTAIASAIGLYVAAVGLKFIGLINQTAPHMPGSSTPGMPLESLALGYLGNPAIYLGLGIFIGALVLQILKIPGSLPLAMIIGLIIGLILHAVGVYNMPNWNSLVHYKEYLDSMGSIKDLVPDKFVNFGKSFQQIPFYIGCVMFLLIIFFESSGATTAFIGELEKYEPSAIPEEKRVVFSLDSASGVVGGFLGVTPCCMFVSTAVGVSQGARTGFAGMFIGFLFLISIPLYPLFYLFFPYANEIGAVSDKVGIANVGGITMSPITGAALIFAGASMFTGLRKVDFMKLEESIPTFIMTAVMVLSASIPNGIVFGFLFYVIILLAKKQYKEINAVTYACTAILIIYFILLILMDIKIIS